MSAGVATPQPLDPLAIPLTGLHLIEASAGTGKTQAITDLVLRLVLEEGLGVDRILVLTFTKAATEELRERIARRLRQALATVAAGGCEGVREGVWGGVWGGADEMLRALLARRPDRARAQTLLGEAVIRMDEAAIHTIHGFCQRLLQDHAFEGGIAFDAELITDETDLRRQAAADLWRRHIATADREEAAWLLAQWPAGPDDLLAGLAPQLAHAGLRILPEEDPGLAAELARLRAWFTELARGWAAQRDEVLALVQDNPSLSQVSYKPKTIQALATELDALFATERLPESMPKGLALLTPAKLKVGTKGQGTTPAHPFFDLCGQVDPAAFADLARRRRAAFLRAARDYLITELARRKRDRRVLYYDDLLSATAAALDGAAGAGLATRIRTAYPRALIDEFQDTDTLQYRIFRRVYAGHEEGGLFLIGDPKQAIYAFRGADIFTYIAARRQAAAAGRIHVLDTNWRSAGALVRAVNSLFERARAPFLFDADIPFVPVHSPPGPGPRADCEPLRLAGDRPVPLQFRWLTLTRDQATSKGNRITAAAAREAAAADCAGYIAGYLAQARLGLATIGEAPLQARDMAVLVRSHTEATLIREALWRQGVASVSVGQASVFESEEAAELASVLAALDDGAGEGALRGALATRILGWGAIEIAALDADEGAWDGLLDRFQDYRACWRERGFLAALSRLMRQESVPNRLRRTPDGERRLTNLLHLLELAQVASREHPGCAGLRRWLTDRRARAGADDEGQLLRLESDEALVRILTLHKSKGLEFPVVCLPFPWSQGGGGGKGDPILFHEREDLTACLDLDSGQSEAHRALADEESLAEGLRLFYVAVTRARHLCVLHWGAVNQAEGSAAAYLLHQGPAGEPAAERAAGLDEAALRADLDALAAAAPGAIAIAMADAAATPRLAVTPVPPDSLRAAEFTGRIPRRWHLLSYSRLLDWEAGGGGERGQDHPDHDALSPSVDDLPRLGPLDQSLAPAPHLVPAASEAIFCFPRGVQAGHCLHALLAQLDFPTAAGAPLLAAVARGLDRYGIEARWTETIAELITRVLDTPLDGADLRLRGLAAADRRDELEFHFRLSGYDGAALSGLLAGHGYPAAGPLGGDGLEGLMKGYIDLTFRAGGRFYIADYKSNHLGDALDDYGPAGLAAAMTAHRYHLQYLIYTLALHRYLGQRLPGYDYDRHMGGSFYLFLRGMRPDRGTARGVYFDRPGRALVEALDQVFDRASGAIP